MAQIPRKLLDTLTEELNAFSVAGRQMVENALSRLVPMFTDADGLIPEKNVAALRNAAYQVMEAVCGELSDLAAARAAQFYDEVRSLSVGARLGARVDSGRVPQATEGAVRALVQSVDDTGQVERFTRELGDRVDVEVTRAANRCVATNAMRDPLKPAYARVPAGTETCPFCLMLSSFGFHYRSPEAASHAHARCDCRVVPDFGEASVDGYDPDGMYDRYNNCLDTIGGRDAIRKEWDALPEAEREAYIKRHGEKPGKAFDSYVNKRISQEIGTRDPEWFKTGIEPEVKVLAGAAPSASEWETARKLAGFGIGSWFRPVRDVEGLKTADVFTVSHGESNRLVEYDFKCPTGNGNQTIYHQFEEAAGQSQRVVIDLVDAGERYKNKEFVEGRTKKFLEYSYTIETGEGKGSLWRFKEVFIIHKDGTPQRITR